MDSRPLTLASLWLAILIAGSSFADPPSPAPPPPPEVIAPAQVVSGLPIPVEFRYPGPREVSWGGLFSRLLPCNVELLDRGTVTSLPRCDRYLGAPSSEISRFRSYAAGVADIPAGRTGRLYTDLSEVQSSCAQTGQDVTTPAARLVPNSYIVSTDVGGVMSALPASLQVVAPNATEAEIAARLARVEVQAPYSRWRMFVAYAPRILDGLDLSTLSETGKRQLQLVLLIQRLAHSPQPIEDLAIDESEVAGMWEVYRPTLRALRLEIARAKGDASAIQTLEAEVLAEDPVGEGVLTTIAVGRGRIAQARDLIQLLKMSPGAWP